MPICTRVFDFPVDLSGRRVDGADAFRVKEHELAHAARLDDDRLVVAGLGIRRQRAPDFLAGVLVERDQLAVRLAADEADQAVAVHERRAGHAPRRDRGIEVA